MASLRKDTPTVQQHSGHPGLLLEVLKKLQGLFAHLSVHLCMKSD
jgi:hypothetical protein